MERSAILELMVKLKLRGMRAAYDEVITLAAMRHHSPEQVVGQLLAAQFADVASRATAYRMGNAHFPAMKTLAEFEFAGSPVNAGAVRELHRGTFLTESRNAVLVGGTGSGKTHLAITIGANCVREREARVRFFNTVDLVNRLEAETRAGKAGRLASQLARTDLVILDELGYLPFPRAGGQMLFHLISRLMDAPDRPPLRQAPLRRPAQALDRGTHPRLDQPLPPPRPRLRTPREKGRCLRPPRHDPPHAPTPFNKPLIRHVDFPDELLERRARPSSTAGTASRSGAWSCSTKLMAIWRPRTVERPSGRSTNRPANRVSSSGQPAAIRTSSGETADQRIPLRLRAGTFS